MELFGIITIVIMPMPKHVISFTPPQYADLNKTATKLGLSVSELVRRAVDDYRMKMHLNKKRKRPSQNEFDRLLKETSGIWKRETRGSSYQKKFREQWKRRHGWDG